MSSEGIFGRLGEKIEADEEDQNPPSLTEILDLSEDQRALMRLVLRAPIPVTPIEAAQELNWSAEVTQSVVGDLSFKGMIDLVGGRIKTAPMQRNTRSTPGGMWTVLDNL